MARFYRCRFHSLAALTLGVLIWTAAAAAGQSMAKDGYILPPESVQDLFRRDKNLPQLNRLSPDGDHFVIPLFQELTDLELMSRRTLRLAMLEFVPEVNREWRLATYGNYGLSLYSLKERRTYPVKLPANSFVSDMRWSPDGSQLAFIAHLEKMSQVWTADVRTGEARAVSDLPVMATLVARPGGGGEAPETAGGRLLQWLPDGSLLTVYTTPTAFEGVKKAIEAAAIPISSAEISMRPSNSVRVEADRAQQVLRLVESLEDLDDVQKVHANFDIPVEVLQHA